MKILYIRPTENEKEIVVSALRDHEVIFAQNLPDVNDEVLASAEVLSVFVDTAVAADVIARCPQLKCIVARSVGFDNIDTRAAKTRGITVCRVPHYGSQTVAEFAFALMFALSRKVAEAQLAMRSQKHLVSPLPFEGFDLGGKTLGVVGTGVIGQHACAIGKSFGMSVLACDTYPSELVSNMGVQYVPLQDLMMQSDIVSLHVPSIPATHHMINADLLNLMKPTAYLINTARGEVVDTQALVDVLVENKIAGAGLDVLEGERDLDVLTRTGSNSSESETQAHLRALNYQLLAMPQVIVTPHIGFNTTEAKNEIIQCTIANIKAFSDGVPSNLIPV